MNKTNLFLSLVVLVGLLLPAADARGQALEDSTVEAAEAVLNEIMSIPLKGIPASMLADAQGIAIVPNVIKGGFIIGARYGRGVLLVRDKDQNWYAPVFVTLTGGNIGFQAGIQSTDVILVFKTRKSVQGVFEGKLTLGADASVAAGPVGREVAAATDGKLSAEIYSYSRSRGLFLGVAFDGSVIRVDRLEGAEYYKSQGPGKPVLVPEPAIKLVHEVTKYCGGGQPPAAGTAPAYSTFAQNSSTTEADALRDQLGQIAPQLYELLDAKWKPYLALPSEVFSGKGHPSPEMLKQCLAHFDAVASNPQYHALAARPEFQSVHGLLKHYVNVELESKGPLKLPPPPAEKKAAK